MSDSVGSESQIDIKANYVEVCLRKKKRVTALIDTGADLNIMPERYVLRRQIKSYNTDLTSASGQKINVVGKATVKFVMGGIEFCEDFTVSDMIDEMILGMRFISKHTSAILFDEEILKIDGLRFKMITKSAKNFVRRIKIRGDVKVPGNSIALVPVEMSVRCLTATEEWWLMDTVHLHAGKIFTARSLLPDNDEFASVSVINIGNEDYTLRSGRRIGEACAGDVVCELKGEDLFISDQKEEFAVTDLAAQEKKGVMNHRSNAMLEATRASQWTLNPNAKTFVRGNVHHVTTVTDLGAPPVIDSCARIMSCSESRHRRGCRTSADRASAIRPMREVLTRDAYVYENSLMKESTRLAQRGKNLHNHMHGAMPQCMARDLDTLNVQRDHRRAASLCSSHVNREVNCGHIASEKNNVDCVVESKIKARCRVISRVDHKRDFEKRRERTRDLSSSESETSSESESESKSPSGVRPNRIHETIVSVVERPVVKRRSHRSVVNTYYTDDESPKINLQPRRDSSVGSRECLEERDHREKEKKRLQRGQRVARTKKERATISVGRYSASGAEEGSREGEGAPKRGGEGERDTERKRQGGQTSLEKERSLRGKYTSLQKAGGEGETFERGVRTLRESQRGLCKNPWEKRTVGADGLKEETCSWQIKRGEFEGRSEASRGGARRGAETEGLGWSREGTSCGRTASSGARETGERETLALAKRSRTTSQFEEERTGSYSREQREYKKRVFVVFKGETSWKLYHEAEDSSQRDR